MKKMKILKFHEFLKVLKVKVFQSLVGRLETKQRGAHPCRPRGFNPL